jgi:hypothetical protein
MEVSLLPWNAFDADGKNWGSGDGDDYRNLQDNAFRFSERLGFGARVYEMYGWTERNHVRTYLLNDLLDREAGHPPLVEVVAHELFHALNVLSGGFDRLSPNMQEAARLDEELARAFGKSVANGG